MKIYENEWKCLFSAEGIEWVIPPHPATSLPMCDYKIAEIRYLDGAKQLNITTSCH